MKKISIISPVYNVEPYLSCFLNSLSSQTMDDFEIILVNDGSTDHCAQLLEQYKKTDPRVTVIHQENKGVSAARNAGLAVAGGEYVYIVDSDDWLEKTALERLWGEAQKTHADVIYGMTYTYNNGKADLRKVFPHSFYTNNQETINEIQCALMNNNYIRSKSPEFSYIRCLGGAPWRGMIKRSIISENGIRFKENLKKLGEDILFWQEIYENVKSVSYIETPIYYYRKAYNSLSHGYKIDLLEIYEKVFREEEQFLISHEKAEDHWEAYYFRVLLYIRQSLDFYYKNKGNRSAAVIRYNEFRKMLQKEPYKTAARTVHINRLVLKKQQFSILLLKWKLYGLYWLCVGR